MTAVLIQTFELNELGECDLTLRLKPKSMQVARFPAARQVATQASFVQSRGSRIDALSGGVEFSLSNRFQIVRKPTRWTPLGSSILPAPASTGGGTSLPDSGRLNQGAFQPGGPFRRGHGQALRPAGEALILPRLPGQRKHTPPANQNFSHSDQKTTNYRHPANWTVSFQ